MVTETLSVLPTDSVLEAVRRMATNRVGAVLVVEKDTLWGLLSERDVVTRVVGEGRDPAHTDAISVATRDVVTIAPDAPLREVMAIFREKKFRHLPVVEKGKPIGILSTRDFLSDVVEGFEKLIDGKKYTAELAAGSDPYDHLGGAYRK